MQIVGRLGVRAILSPPRIIGVDDSITASAELGESRRLTVSRQPRHQDTRHIRTTLPSVKRLGVSTVAGQVGQERTVLARSRPRRTAEFGPPPPTTIRPHVEAVRRKNGIVT